MGTVHKNSLIQLQERHQAQMKVLDEEKKRMKEEMSRTLELERDKIRAQQRLDIEQKDMQHQRAIDAQRRSHEEQTEQLRKQIEQ